MISLVKADFNDAQILTDITIRAFNDETRRFGPGRDGGPDGYDSVEITEKLIKTVPYYKIINDDCIVGAVFLRKISDIEYELNSICIDPAYQNLGIGSKSIELIENKYSTVNVWTLSTPYYSKRNHHFYEKHGYKKIGKSNDDFLFFYEKRK
jgi:GNAT superfamily N-acetyltransferase